MLPKLIYLLPALLLNASLSFAQKVKSKVVRKGTYPTNVVKVTSSNVPKYTVSQLSGKWQEISRTNRSNGKAVTFLDTIFLSFSGNNVFTRDGVNMSLKGKAVIEDGNSLMAAADVYTIKSLDNKEAIFDDGEKYVHRLVKKSNFWYESLPSTSIPTPVYELPVSINIKNITGKWQVYRRDAKPGSLPTADYLIKMINVSDIKDEHNATGEISFNLEGKLETAPCSFSIENDKLSIISEKYTWLLHTYKADGNEFVFGDRDLMYFSKP